MIASHSHFQTDRIEAPAVATPVSETLSSRGIAAKERAAGLRRWGQILGAPFLGLIWVYQRLVSPALHLAGGPSCGCRFYPTCSEYAAGAIRTHGPLRGLLLAVGRLIRCSPLHPGGVDFVPPRSALRPRCDRVTSSVRPTS